MDGFEGNNPGLQAALHRIDLFLVHMGALLGLFAAAYLLQAPPWALDWLVLAIRLYATFAAGVVLIRSAGLLVDIVETVARTRPSVVAGSPTTRAWRRWYRPCGAA